MANLLKRRRASPAGTPPGTLTSYPGASAPVLSMMAFGADTMAEPDEPSVAGIAALRDEYPVLWVNVSGLADIELISRLGDLFGLNALALEDVINVHQRPKVEEFADHLFVVVRMMLRTGPDAPPDSEQVSLFLGEGYVLTFQERPGDCFDPVRERARHSRGRLRRQGPDYLAYALIDAAIDSYFPVIEIYGDELEALEDAVIAAPERGQAERLHRLRRDLLLVRRSVWPTREMVNALIRDETRLVSDQTRTFLRDAYDHTIQLMDLVETYREIASGLLDVYLSGMSARLNEVMKVLTIIATIFMPLSFLAGLWGMNFDRASPWNMPELGWAFGYPLALLLMAAIGGLLSWYFWHKGWLAGDPAGKRGE